jgi:hypothetical protein
MQVVGLKESFVRVGGPAACRQGTSSVYEGSQIAEMLCLRT